MYRFIMLFSFAISIITLAACQSELLVANNRATQTPLTKISEISETNFAAHWLSQTLLVLPKENSYSHHELISEYKDIKKTIILTPTKENKNSTSIPTYLKGFSAYQVNLSRSEIKQWLKTKLYVASSSESRVAKQISYVQSAALLDNLYTKNSGDANEIKDFGATIKKNSIQFKLWAPTAISVTLLTFDANKKHLNSINMIENTKTGSWSTNTSLTQADIYYQYQVEVYHPRAQKVLKVISTDPYSLSLSANSTYSHVIDLNHNKTKPDGWQKQQDVLIDNPEDNIFYETHIRDFSAHDPFLSTQSHSGKYKAFSEKNSAGIKHLKSLQQAGINNIHLLPTFDMGTVNEDAAKILDLNDPLSKLCSLLSENSLCDKKLDKSQSIKTYLKSLPKDDSQRQQVISSFREIDNYNWGYDPFHYTVPEGSYALNPEGSARILEFREMILSIHNLGFRVIMDVVYNHTHQAGLKPTAVLDKLVPNYYHRLDPITGAISQSTCCDNTATERVMMAKLMTDSLVVWAKEYKIDGFRFDLMAHQPKSVMLKARQAVQAVDPDTYFYGEGWNFGEVANNQRFIQASQLELGGTQIGTFTDRLRDAVRGGAFSAQGSDIRKSQGIGNGLVTFPNELNDNELNDNELSDGKLNKVKSLQSYYLFADQLRIGLAGNLANFPLINAQGKQVLGKDIPYGEQPTGYALDPADTINYVSKHDNQTLWDNNQYRLPFNTSTSDRVRFHLQSLSFAILAQGIPFLHMGSELLRSKSFLRYSYDYGDWFNKVDFTMSDNNYNVGLPPADKDQANWSLIKEILDKNQQRDHVSSADIQFSSTVFKEFIKIRMSSPLFRLTNANEIIKRVKFHNTGPQQQMGLIAMTLDDSDDANILDKNYSQILVVFNTSTKSKVVNSNDLNSQNYQLHSIQSQGVDDVVKSSEVTPVGFVIPPLTSAIFVKHRQLLP